MQWVLQLIAQAAKWTVSSPQHARITMIVAKGLQDEYKRLTPAQREKVNGLIIEGAKLLAKLTLGEASGWVTTQAEKLGLSHGAAELARKGLTRASEVGVDKAIEELRKNA